MIHLHNIISEAVALDFELFSKLFVRIGIPFLIPTLIILIGIYYVSQTYYATRRN